MSENKVKVTIEDKRVGTGSKDVAESLVKLKESAKGSEQVITGLREAQSKLGEGQEDLHKQVEEQITQAEGLKDLQEAKIEVVEAAIEVDEQHTESNEDVAKSAYAAAESTDDLGEAQGDQARESAKAVRSLDQLNDELAEARTALHSAEIGTEQFTAAQRRVTTIEQKRAVAMKTGAKSQRNMGLATLEASRAFEDLQYGIGGVLNNIPGLIQMLGGTAGLAGIISVVAVGASLLFKHLDEGRDKVKALEVSLDKLVDESFKDFQAAIKDEESHKRFQGLLEKDELALDGLISKLRLAATEREELRKLELEISVQDIDNDIARIDAGDGGELEKERAKAPLLKEKAILQGESVLETYRAEQAVLEQTRELIKNDITRNKAIISTIGSERVTEEDVRKAEKELDDVKRDRKSTEADFNDPDLLDESAGAFTGLDIIKKIFSDEALAKDDETRLRSGKTKDEFQTLLKSFEIALEKGGADDQISSLVDLSKRGQEVSNLRGDSSVRLSNLEKKFIAIGEVAGQLANLIGQENYKKNQLKTLENKQSEQESELEKAAKSILKAEVDANGIDGRLDHLEKKIPKVEQLQSAKQKGQGITANKSLQSASATTINSELDQIATGIQNEGEKSGRDEGSVQSALRQIAEIKKFLAEALQSGGGLDNKEQSQLGLMLQKMKQDEGARSAKQAENFKQMEDAIRVNMEATVRTMGALVQTSGTNSQRLRDLEKVVSQLGKNRTPLQ
ncbi:hypothetical protein [Rubritalea sp.]|uniref:hypothetical protein n=1 Tax=Rubritalea sp. TaxID=2109375 RepID=UPI003EF29671